jgi:hypothetical protein
MSHTISQWRALPEGGKNMGLLWAQILTEIHGGELTFHPADDEGFYTKARITFPMGAVKVRDIVSDPSSREALFERTVVMEEGDFEGFGRARKRGVLLGGLKFTWSKEADVTQIPEDIQGKLDLVVNRWEAIYEGTGEDRLVSKIQPDGSWKQVEMDRDYMVREIVMARFDRVLEEILTNATDAFVFSRELGPITLGIYRVKDEIVLELLDSGIGIRWESITGDYYSDPRLLHWDLANGRDKYRASLEGGKGMGLLWSQILVKLHGGKFEIVPATEDGYRTKVRFEG